MTCLLIFFNRSMMTSRRTMLKNNRAKLAKLFMLVILIGLFFRQWFTHFCDIYVFLLQFRRNLFFFFSTLSSPRVRISRLQFAICKPIFRICELRSSTAAYFCESILSQVESCSRKNIPLFFYISTKFTSL